MGEIKGGSAVNIIPDEAFASIGFRPLPDSSVDAIFERIRARALQSCTVAGAKININLENCSPAMMTRSGTKLESILKPYAKTSDQVAAAFSTDAGNLSHSGIDCLIFGPGSIDIAHQANEWVRKTDLELAASKLENIVDDYCRTA